MAEGAIELRLDAPGRPIALIWDPELLAALGKDPHSEHPWRLEGEPDWERMASLTVLSAAFEDGALLALAALRPRGAEGHDEDLIEALHARANVEPERLADVLLSVQRDAEGTLERVNLEAATTEGHGIVRAAGDAEARGDGEAGTGTVLAMRMAGAAGFGTIEVLPRP
jgi:hypothetical protein